MSESVIKGKRALVTGASSGLGLDFARDLAGRGCHLILVARREDRLRALQKEIVDRHGVEVDVIPADLSAPDAPPRLYDRIKAGGKAVDILVNNAGFGLYGTFLEIPRERERNMLELDILTLVGLTRFFVKDMVERDFGFVLNVSSIAAYQPTPLYATYAAAKTFVLHFSEALSYELRKTKVQVTALSPGITATEFLEVSGQKPTAYQERMMMTSPEVTRIGVEAMLRGRPSVVPGLVNAVMAWATRLAPRRLTAAVAYRLMLTR
jgi:short-subunit dehydrogenase